MTLEGSKHVVEQKLIKYSYVDGAICIITYTNATGCKQ
jgi:hypothetical protein